MLYYSISYANENKECNLVHKVKAHTTNHLRVLAYVQTLLCRRKIFLCREKENIAIAKFLCILFMVLNLL